MTVMKNVLYPSLYTVKEPNDNSKTGYIELAEVMTNQPHHAYQNTNLETDARLLYEKGVTWARRTTFVYKICNTILLCLGLFFWFRILWQRKWKKMSLPEWFSWLSIFVLTGINLVYAFGIVWFTEFIYMGQPVQTQYIKLNNYAGGSFALWNLVLVLSACLVWLSKKWKTAVSGN